MSSIAKPAASRRKSATSSLRAAGRERGDREEDREQREHGQREPRGPAEQPAVREPRRDERTHVGRVGVLDAFQPLVRRVADVREAREHLAFEVHDERVVVGIARIGERGRGIELVPGLDPNDPHARAGVDLEHARERDGPTDRLERLGGAGVVRERAVADAGQHDDLALRAPRGTTVSAAASRGCAASARVGIGATLAEHVERVAREHDHRRAAAALDRVRDRPRDLAGDVGSARASGAGRRRRGPGRRGRPTAGPRRRPSARRDARSTSSAPAVGRRSMSSSDPSVIVTDRNPRRVPGRTWAGPRRPRRHGTCPSARPTDAGSQTRRTRPRPDPVSRPGSPAQATATPSNAAARTPRCASSARNGTGSTSAPRPCTPGPVEPRLERAGEPRRDDGQHRARGDRGALDDAVDRAVEAAVAPAPHLDPGRAPFALVAEAAAEAGALGRLAELHADAGDVGKRVDQQRGARR